MHDAKGDAVAISWLPLGAQVNIAHFAGFSVVRDDPQAGLFVSPATRSPTDERWVYPLLRRLETPSGEFAGVIGARGRIDYLQQFYHDVHLDPGTKVTLMHRNATLLARDPPIDVALGQYFPLFDKMLAERSQGKPATTRTVSPIDGVERFGAFRAVPDYPLEVLVTRDKSRCARTLARNGMGHCRAHARACRAGGRADRAADAPARAAFEGARQTQRLARSVCACGGRIERRHLGLGPAHRADLRLSARARVARTAAGTGQREERRMVCVAEDTSGRRASEGSTRWRTILPDGRRCTRANIASATPTAAIAGC